MLFVRAVNALVPVHVSTGADLRQRQVRLVVNAAIATFPGKDDCVMFVLYKIVAETELF